MIFPESDEKPFPKSSLHRDEEVPSPDQDQSPPPYNSLPSQAQGSSSIPTESRKLLPELAPANYLHVKEKNNSVKRKILLDLSLPRPPASALPVPSQDEDIRHLTLDSYNGSVSGEVWVLHPNSMEGSAVAQGGPERVHLHFHSHNGSVKAQVHLHPSTVEPRPYLSIEVKSENGAIFLAIPRSFRGQMMLHTDNGRVTLSSALATRAATLSTLNGTNSYFVGERPSSGKWHTGTGEDGEEVHGVIGSSKNGSVKVSYDDEDVIGTKGSGVLNSLLKAIGL